MFVDGCDRASEWHFAQAAGSCASGIVETAANDRISPGNKKFRLVITVSGGSVTPADNTASALLQLVRTRFHAWLFRLRFGSEFLHDLAFPLALFWSLQLIVDQRQRNV